MLPLAVQAPPAFMRKVDDYAVGIVFNQVTPAPALHRRSVGYAAPPASSRATAVLASDAVVRMQAQPSGGEPPSLPIVRHVTPKGPADRSGQAHARPEKQSAIHASQKQDVHGKSPRSPAVQLFLPFLCPPARPSPPRSTESACCI